MIVSDSTRSISSRHLLLLLLAAVLLLLPAVIFGAGGFDLRCQTLWMKFFADQFWHGDLYPRWLMDMYAGNGAPVFFYYPPVAYFITVWFSPLASLDPYGYFPLAASACLAAWVGGITFYLWMRAEGQSPQAALAGGLLYMAAPANIPLNFYYSLLFSSVWAYAWVPLLLLTAKRLSLSQPFAWAGFSGVLCLLIMTNLPMTIVFGPLAVAYAGYMILCNGDSLIWQRMCVLAVAVALGFGLSALFLFPALAYMDFANVAMHWTSDAGDYHNYFLKLGFGALNQKVYSGTWFAMLALALVYWRLLKRAPLATSFFAAASLVGLFMILPYSEFIWSHLSFLKVIQFPERFFIVPSLGLAALAAFAMPRLRRLCGALFAIYIAIAFTLAAWDSRMPMERLQQEFPMQYDMFTLGIDQHVNYLPSKSLIDRFYTVQGIEEVKAHPEKVETLSGDAKTRVVVWKPREIVIYYQAQWPSRLRIRQFDFPGHRAFLDDGSDIDIEKGEKTGQIVLNVPVGTHEIKIELTALVPELAGRGITILCALLLALGVLLQIWHRKGGMSEVRRSLFALVAPPLSD